MDKSILHTFEEAAKAITHRAFEYCMTAEHIEKATADASTLIRLISEEAGKRGIMTAYEQGLYVAFANGYMHKHRAKVAERVSKRVVVTVFA